MRQQDKILSRQKTRLNPIKSHSSSCGGGEGGTGEQNNRRWQHYKQDPMWLRERGGHAAWTNALNSLPFRSSAAPLRPALASLNHQRYVTGQTLGQKVKKAGSGIQCHKNVLGRQIQYTHTHFCYLVLGGGGEGQDTVISPVPSTWNLMNDIAVFTSLWERQTSFT